MSDIDHKAGAEALMGSGDDSGKPTSYQFEGLIAATLHAAEQTRLNTLAILFTAPDSEFRIDWVRKQLEKGLGL